MYVAIVDDEEPVLKALKRLLLASGLEAEGFATGKAFLEASARRRPDCVLLDLHMKGMSGLDLLRELRAREPMIPAVVLTAHDDPGTREACLAAGARAYLCKPLDDRALLSAISASLSPVVQSRR